LGDKVDVDLQKGDVYVNGEKFTFSPLPSKLMEILKARGLVNWIKKYS
jgi:3-isopropylmalate dehydratase small subunit